ncbi:MAG: hypothetical protein IKP24_00205 [Alphaproteobacteria bacterium]|nr:hypothetical protein [Alphaproteobacteria bacterium]
MFLQRCFHSRFIICAMFVSLFSVHVAYAADPVKAIEINDSGNCVADSVENAKAVHWDSRTNTCIVDTCADNYTLYDNQCIKSCDREVLNAKYAKDGYMQEDKCIITLCVDGYDLDTQDNLCKSRESGGSSGTTVTADCGKNLFNPQLMTEGGFTYTSSNYLFKGKFSRAYNALNHTYSGDFLSNYYMSKYSYGLQKDTKYKLTYQIKCDENDIGNMYIGMLLKDGDTETKEIPNNVCSGNTGLQTVTLRGGGNGTDVIGVFLGRLGDTDYTGDVEISNVMLVLDDEDTSRMIPYGPCIKISTKMATATRATGVEERLSNVRSIISDLITRTQENANGINGLQNEKQTRPVDSNACPSNKTCLLVKDTGGHNNWYEIMTCDSGNFFDTGAIDHPIYGNFDTEEPFGFREGNNVSYICEDSDAGCTDGEWVSSYENGLVYGVAQSLSISNPVGSIVTLPTMGLVSGNVCVCRATDYRVLDTDTNTYGSRVHINTDKWVVAGAPVEGSCAYACSRFDVDQDFGSMLKRNYYSYLDNSCMPGVSQANMCYWDASLDAVVSGGVGVDVGWITNNNNTSDAERDGDCRTGEYFASNSHCAESVFNIGNWLVSFASNNGGVNQGYVWGISGYTTVPSGTVTGDIVNVRTDSVHWRPQSGENAIVCVVRGSKTPTASEESIASGAYTSAGYYKAFVASVTDADYYDNGAYHTYSAYEMCAIMMGRRTSAVEDYYDELLGDCPRNN